MTRPSMRKVREFMGHFRPTVKQDHPYARATKAKSTPRQRNQTDTPTAVPEANITIHSTEKED